VCCAECADCDLCSDCFAAGAARLPHKNTHAYRVVDCLDVPLFVKDWTINEELMLLEGVEKYGAGNWKSIADYLGTGKTVRQLEEHYWEGYMGIHGHCLPQRLLDLGGAATATAAGDSQSQAMSQADEAEGQKRSTKGTIPLASLGSKAAARSSIPTISGVDRLTGLPWTYQAGEAVLRDVGVGVRGAPQGLSTKAKDKAAQDLRERLATLPGADLPGFIPLREDFDIEHENDAELLLADMEFSPDDHPSERELKLQVVGIYNKKLDERNRRKRYAIDRGLVDFKKQQQLDRKRTKEEREMAARLRMFAPFQTPDAHEALVEGLIKARRLRQHILLFQQCRKLGIRTLHQVRDYETDRKKREQELKARKAREGTQYLFEGAQQSSSSSRRRLEEDDEHTDYGGYNNKRARAGGKRTTGGETNSADLAKAPGVDLLSENEVALCSQLPMLPLHYLAVKEACVREAYRNGRLTVDGMKRVVTLAAPKEARLFDFFVKESAIVGGGGDSGGK